MLKVNWNNCILFLLEVYIIISFFSFRSLALESIYLLALLIIYMVGKAVIGVRPQLSKDYIVCIVIAMGSVLISSLFSQYSQLYTVGVFVCLYLLEMLAENDAFSMIENMKPDLFYIGMILSLVLLLVQCYQQGVFKVKTLMGDQNYTGILVFCIFMYSLKCKYISGFILTALYTIIFNNSRGFIFLLLLFALFWALRKPLYRIISRKDRIWLNLFLIFIISTAFMILFSYFWVYVVSATTFTTIYKASLNDASNRIRALSIMRGVQMLGNVKDTFLGGYGSELLEVMGISGTDYSQHPTFMGLRLAQPHNTVINLAVRIGIVPALVYCFILSKVLSRYISEENIPYFFPFFMISLFMHSLMIWQWLVLLVIILSMPQSKRSIIRWKLKRNETANRPYSIYFHR